MRAPSPISDVSSSDRDRAARLTELAGRGERLAEQLRDLIRSLRLLVVAVGPARRRRPDPQIDPAERP